MKARCANWGMSKRLQRAADVPAFLLHAAPWRETSLLLQVFTRDYGIVALVAKGAKRPHSMLRPVLHAFQPLLLSWSGAGDVRTLTRADWAGMLPLSGRAYMSAWYMNELLVRLLPRDDPHPVLFDAYDEALRQLAASTSAVSALRRFEWVLLSETGYGFGDPAPDFDHLADERGLRALLRERLDSVLERPLLTRKVLMELQQF